MKKLLLLLLSVSAAAQTINPNQIRPSATNGQVVTTVGGVSIWSDPPGVAPYVTVTGAPSGTIPAAGILAYNDNPSGGIANGTDLINQPNGTTPTPSNGGFNFIYVDPSNVHNYLGGINDMGDFGMHGGVAGNWAAGQTFLPSLAYLVAFNNKGVGTYLSLDELGVTSGFSHITNVTNSGRSTPGFKFDVANVDNIFSPATVLTVDVHGNTSAAGQVSGSSLSTSTPTVGTTCTVGGFVTLTIDGTPRKLAYCN